MVGKFRHIEQIVGDAAHDLAHLGVVIVAVSQTLQMGKGIPAHVGLDVDAHDMAGAAHIIAGRAVNQAQHQIQRRQFQHGLHREYHRRIGGGVGKVTHDFGKDDVAQRCERRTGKI